MTTVGKLPHKQKQAPKPRAPQPLRPNVSENLDGVRGKKRSVVDLQADAMAMLLELPNQVGSRQGLWSWATSQGWGTTRTWNCLRRVNAIMHERTQAESVNALGKILATIDAMLPQCRRPRFGTEVGVGTVIVEDETGEPLWEIDHAAVARYLELIAKLLGLLKIEAPVGGQTYVIALPAPIPGSTREDQLGNWAKLVQAEVHKEKT